VNPTQECVNPTQECVNPTQECVNPTQECVNPTQECVNPTQECVNPTQVFGALMALMLLSPTTTSGQRALQPTPELQLAAGIATVVLLLTGCAMLTWHDVSAFCAQCHRYACVRTTLWDCDAAWQGDDASR
jgi:hypothetical protein